LASFDVEFLTSGAVPDLMQKVKIIASPELDRHFPKYWAGRVTVKSGSEVYSEEVIIPKGESGNPMGRDEVEEKFLSLAAPVIGNEKMRSVVREVESLDSRASLDHLLAFLNAPD
jgi:2-methylcitrate dehydratase PrpD